MQTLALASPNTFGEQRVAVILVNFQNLMAAPYTAGTAQSVTFGEVNQFYLDNSYGQTSITGQRVRVVHAADQCAVHLRLQPDRDESGSGGRRERREPEPIRSARSTRSRRSACADGGVWGRLAEIRRAPGSTAATRSRSWDTSSDTISVIYHSNSKPCSTGGCSASEYGDDRDMMGMSAVGHFNGFQKERLGWLNYGSSPPIQNVTSSGTYWIEAYGTASNGGPKALRILKSTDSGGNRTWYYIESRAQLGFDNGFNAGVTVHTGSESTGNSSYQVDLVPTTTSFDSLLDPGQMFTDPASDIAIRTVSASDAGAFVDDQLRRCAVYDSGSDGLAIPRKHSRAAWSADAAHIERPEQRQHVKLLGCHVRPEHDGSDGLERNLYPDDRGCSGIDGDIACLRSLR